MEEQATPAEKAGTFTIAQIAQTLMPAPVYGIEDVLGNRYTLRSALPMRRQIKVARIMGDLKEAVVESGLVDELREKIGEIRASREGAGDADATAVGADMLASVGGKLVGLLMEEETATKLSEAFAVAHPRVVAQAQKAATEADWPEDERVSPMDLFAGEDIVRGLLPFWCRLISEVGQTWQEMVPTTTDAETPPEA